MMMEKDMKHYDPEDLPDAEAWLALDETERIDLVLQYHRRARVKLPNATLHAAIHAVVENQVALGDDIPVRRALERLQTEGLDRHEAIHAVGSVLAKHMYDLLKAGVAAAEPNKLYWDELEHLTAESWRLAR
jgi:hypothetical protein